MRSLPVRVARFIDRFDMLPAHSSIIAGISGGPDSMCLLRLLHDLAGPRGWRLTAAHVNHLLRAVESDDDERFVEAQCAGMGIPLRCLQVDVRQLAAESGDSIETAARRARYRFFNQLADEAGNTPVRIAVAHHREDQAETLLMHLFRGSGLDGLAGMSPVAGRIVRPLLEASRTDILAYLSSTATPYRIDSSNAFAEATRNRVRLELLPLAADLFGPDPAGRLAGTAETLREDAEFLRASARKKREDIRLETGVDRHALLDLPGALSVRIVRILYEEATGTRADLGRDHGAAVLALAASDRIRSSVDLPGLVRAECEKDVLRMTRQDDREPKASWESVPLCLSGSTTVPPGRFHAADTRDVVKNLVFGRENLLAAFRRSALAGAVVRTRNPGDRIRPFGRQGSRSLKRFLIDRRVPAAERFHIPIVAVGDSVAWIPGLAVSAEYRWDPDCDRVTDCVWLAYCPTGGIIG